MGEDPTDDDLLAQWRGGDNTAADLLLARHFVAVARVFRYKADDALEDLVQQTFLVCVEQREQFEPGRSLRAYLLGIAYNLLRRYFEQRLGPRGRIDVVTTSLGQLGELSPSSTVALDREKAEVLAALRSVPLEFQVALELFYWEEMTAGEIAGVLGIPEGTVRSRLRIGRERIREYLHERTPGTDPDDRARALR